MIWKRKYHSLPTYFLAEVSLLKLTHLLSGCIPYVDQMFRSMAFVLSYYSPRCAKFLFLKMVFLGSHTFTYHSQGEDSEPEESISQESNITSNLNGFLEIPTVHNRTARSTHPCVLGIVKEFDSWRNSFLVEIPLSWKYTVKNHIQTVITWYLYTAYPSVKWCTATENVTSWKRVLHCQQIVNVPIKFNLGNEI